MAILMRAFIVLTFVLVVMPCSAQFVQVPLGGVAYPHKVVDLNPSLLSLEMPGPGTGSYRAWLEEQKAQMPTPSPQTAFRKTHGGLPTPNIHRQYEANQFSNSVPGDNDMAISNDGMVVAVANTTLWAYDVEADTLVTSISLQAFSSVLGLPDSKYDPRALYDPEADRFIVVCLNGTNSGNTNIVVAFSQTNHPGDGWNVFAIDGNPRQDTTWTDYPMIAITENELFLTGNLLRDGEPWQTGFAGTIVWQIDKHDGYAGTALDIRIWDSIDFGGRPIRNLCPVKGGMETKGPNMYFMSNRNFAASNDSIFLVEITGEAQQGGTQLTATVTKSNTAYGFPPNADMPIHGNLATNDARILEAFLDEDNRIHFAGNTVEPGSGMAAIYLGVLTNPGPTPSVSGKILSDTVHYGYPDMAYTGNGSGDMEGMITFDYSGANTNPGFGAIYFTLADESERLVIREGEDFINVLTSQTERWGDYSGAQRKYDEDGVVWCVGTYAKKVNPTTRVQGAWVAELSRPSLSTASRRGAAQTKVWPVPAKDAVTVEFTTDQGGSFDAMLFDLQGSLVHHIVRKATGPGAKRFEFSTAHLASGTYLLKLSVDGQAVETRQVIVQ